jgi:hypothetical protein
MFALWNQLKLKSPVDGKDVLQDAALMNLVNSPLGRYTDCGDEKLCAAFNHDVKKFGEVAFCVVVLEIED